jgi:hypothetical protein
MPAHDIAAVAICGVILAASWWLNCKARDHMFVARAHLARSRALLEREDPPPRSLYAVDESEPK